MAGKVVGWAFDEGREHDLSPVQRYVLIAYADNAGEKEGKCWPDKPEIAEKTGLSRATVYRAIAALEEKGLLRFTTDQKGRECVYLSVPWSSQSETPPLSHSETDLSQSETELSQSETRSNKGTVKNRQEPSLGAQGSGDSSRSGQNGQVTAEMVETVYNKWQELFRQRKRDLPPEESEVIRKALRQCTLDEALICLQACYASDYHMKRGKYLNRDGRRYDTISHIFRPRKTRETQRERIDFWLGRAENAGSSVPSADPAVISRRKQEVQRGHRLQGDPVAVRKAKEAEAWLKRHGIEAVRLEDGFPTFQNTSGP